jgi:Domain of unknown function (DUF4417)
MAQQSNLFLQEMGSLCSGCPFFVPCGAARSKFACREDWGLDREGGQETLQPGFEATNEFIESVGGPHFDGPALPVDIPSLPEFLPPIKPIEALAGHLHEPIYAVSAETVIGKRKELLRADEIRETLRLSEKQKIVLLLFGKDRFIERLWNQAQHLFPQLVDCNFDLLVGPSYSTYLPRPRPEFIYAVKRSLLMFQAFQELGIPAILRIAWVIEYDALRIAQWVNAHPAVTTVALDWTGSKSQAEWLRQIEGLKTFDLATGQRLKYVINGPSTPSRIQALLELVNSQRLTLTGEILAKPPRSDATPALDVHSKKAEIFFSQCTERREMIASAIRSLEAHQASTAESRSPLSQQKAA